MQSTTLVSYEKGIKTLVNWLKKLTLHSHPFSSKTVSHAHMNIPAICPHSMSLYKVDIEIFKSRFDGCTMLELGAGLGLCSIIVGRVAKRVFCTGTY